ncbi:MAG: VOC family protein [Gammaproteobacteria bacterium]|jgi:catechol 2,3-dioxygenase-like lactoylglutathione lyase family enzyme
MAIFTHVVLGTNDLQKATQFYDATLGALGIKNLGPMGDRGVLYGVDGPELLITKPRNGEPACHANGGTIGFHAPSREAVHRFHEAGLANGGSDEGEPGPREFAPTAYASYLRDPDGNKICTYSFTPE